MAFINEDFILYNDTARELYEAVKDLPIVDYHNHLDPKAIYENCGYNNISEVWLSGDHYKWRAMRANGVPEEKITGSAEPYEKFLAWADTVQNCIGNPLYHWTHLELKRYFDIEETMSKDTAPAIWEKANAVLSTPDFTVQRLLERQNVKVLCTTDDPADSLEWHKKIKEAGISFSVYPSFRPGNVLDIEKPGFAEYMKRLGEAADVEIFDIDSLMEALLKRLDFFMEMGCRVTDHSLETGFYEPATKDEVNDILKRRLEGAGFSEGSLKNDSQQKEDSLTALDGARFRGYVLRELGRAYAKRGLVMQLHIGAIRNNSTRMFEKLGVDSGFDSLNDFNYAPQLSALLDSMDLTDELPKTILYCLNPKDMRMLAAMAGNYQGNDRGIRGKVQLGAAWWFCDHLRGMEDQLDALADVGLISTFVGMLTDSRSFLSFPRHEYFRRILCNKIGTWVEAGQYPKDMDYLVKMVRGICYNNAMEYFGFPED